MALTLRQSLVLYGLFMVLAVAGVTYFVQTAPPLPEAQCANIVTPMDVVRGKLVKEPQTSILNLWNCLREYKKDNWWHTTAGIWGIYVIFKIFGPFGAGTSMVLSVLIGALYDEWAEPMTRYSFLAHFLGVSGEVCGGAGGWIMSYCIGREILLHFAAEKMATLKKEMDKFQGSMFRYMLFLRVSPLFPNWFVNYSTAMIGMPFWYFLVASTLAIQPAACMSIAMGSMLRDVGESGLDLVKMTKRGGMMAATMALLSLPLIPADDWPKGLERVKAFWKRMQKAPAAPAAPVAPGAAPPRRRRKAIDPVRIRAGFTTREETCTVTLSTAPSDSLETTPRISMDSTHHFFGDKPQLMQGVKRVIGIFWDNKKGTCSGRLVYATCRPRNTSHPQVDHRNRLRLDMRNSPMKRHVESHLKVMRLSQESRLLMFVRGKTSARTLSETDATQSRG